MTENVSSEFVGEHKSLLDSRNYITRAIKYQLIGISGFRCVPYCYAVREESVRYLKAAA